MSDPTTNKLTIAEYNEAKLKHSDLMEKAVSGLAAAQQAGDLAAAKAWSETLEILVLPMESLKEQFLQLSPQDQFVSKYSVEKINDHQVRLVLPQGTSRIALLEEAQEIERELYGRDAVYPNQLKKWQNDNDFISKTTSTTKLAIDGRFEGLDAKSREEQELLLKVQCGEMQMAPFADLAVAHTAFFILTGKSLFHGQLVRACDGTLFFGSFGLDVCSYDDDVSSDAMSASRSLPSTN